MNDKIRTVTQLRDKLEEVFQGVNSPIMETSLNNKIINNGIGFFPYGSGLIGMDLENLPKSGVMILGQDFGTINYLDNDVLSFGEENKTTYRNTISIIPDRLKAIFFSHKFIDWIKKATCKNGRKESSFRKIGRQ